MRWMVWSVLIGVTAGCVKAEVAMRETVAPVTLGARDAVGEGDPEPAAHTVVSAFSGSTYERQWNTGQQWGKEWAYAPVLDAAATESIQANARRGVRKLEIRVKTFCVAGSYESARADLVGEVVEVGAAVPAPPEMAPEAGR